MEGREAGNTGELAIQTQASVIAEAQAFGSLISAPKAFVTSRRLPASGPLSEGSSALMDPSAVI